MKLFELFKKKEEDCTDFVTSPSYALPNLYLVVIQWYDTAHVTSEQVEAGNKSVAIDRIAMRYRGQLRNHDYGIVNIIEL